MKYLALITFFFLAPFAHAAIAFDQASNCATASSCSVTVSASANPGLYVVVHGDVGGALGAASCTYKSISMHLLNQFQISGDRTQYSFYITGADGAISGANTLACSGPTFIRILDASYTGVSQGAPPNQQTKFLSGSQSSISDTLTISSANDWAVIFGYSNTTGTFSTGVGVITTERGTANDGGFDADSNGTVSSGSQTVGYNNSASSSGGLTLSIEMDLTPPVAATPTSILGLVWSMWTF